MAFNPISGTVPQYSKTVDNTLALDYWLKFYLANTTTPLSVATDDTGGTLLAKIKLNPGGYPISNTGDNDSIFIPHTDVDYRIVLYKSEADADADDTAAAEFNIADTPTGSLPATSSDSVVLRGATLQQLDDYDRSPLFVDVDDFTAGAPPHVITVPAGWSPASADTRFWKFATDGTITAAVISAQDSTTFTVNETLLSTDTIFIGDDTNRNIHDGDPADIRERLDVPANGEALIAANSLSEIAALGTSSQKTSRDNLVPDIAGLTKHTGGYIDDDGDSQGGDKFDVRASVTENVFESVGPTGSGADNIWTALDILPANTKLVEIMVNGSVGNAATTTVSLLLYARKAGSSAAIANIKKLDLTLLVPTGTISLSGTVSFKVPLDSSNRFDVQWTDNGSATSVLNLFLQGFAV